MTSISRKTATALHKPTLQEPHEGGKRLEVGSWEYKLLLNWIKGGAKPRPEDAAELKALEITPAEVRFSTADGRQQLKAVAVWGDGVREDVTCLCRFQSNDEAIAGIDPTGLVKAGAMGDTHIVVSYDHAVVAVPVLRPVSELIDDKFPAVATPTEIDQLVVQKLRKLGVVPSDVCTDSEFVRCVSLDLSGTLPTADDVREFWRTSRPTSGRRRSMNCSRRRRTPRGGRRGCATGPATARSSSTRSAPRIAALLPARVVRLDL